MRKTALRIELNVIGYRKRFREVVAAFLLVLSISMVILLLLGVLVFDRHETLKETDKKAYVHHHNILLPTVKNDTTWYPKDIVEYNGVVKGMMDDYVKIKYDDYHSVTLKERPEKLKNVKIGQKCTLKIIKWPGTEKFYTKYE